ncbi:nucleoside diphosphate kinase regulator [Siccirubricoccus sp. KC 17139]|uniref:Nucleoside diphosphate kinase regulator n=1 Tax=Siccirubricoccus soli TaxID=2899147 RepID=A0ABT1D6Z4_9PROT|nr:nucleoside diphosphate kinase regulator [Siccirubricoccus soli]MCO6417649.1 nucleoside diphosphate kinase regulator [Siccirubricoccus soli]MCP2683784.1 nucleoside diphosphate kinase regulator [Siccirubricoccus soli]
MNAVSPRHGGRRATAHAAPPIILSTADEERLSRLAAAASQRSPEVAERLLGEIDRARLLPPEKMPPDVVAMHSYVEYSDEATGVVRHVQLVYPHEADIASGRISVLTLVGAALLGLSAGRSIRWPTQQGHERVLTVLRVSPQPFEAAEA